MASPPNPLKAPQHVLTLLARLHRESLEQEASLGQYLTDSAEFHDAMRDKFIALDEDKCQFVYHLACAIGARNIVEAGTSFGVSTIYLALAVGNNIKRLGGQGIVIGTEKESSKAEKAAEYWREAGDSVEPYIELRVGDLQETLKLDLPIVDLLLLDSKSFGSCVED
jgi:predicted O-methyltransferase YrrM